MSTKTEGVAHSCTHLALLRLVEGEVEIVIQLGVFVAFLVVDGGRNNVVFHSQNAHHSLYCACCTEHMAGHRLGGTDVELVGCFAEHFLDGLCLGNVAYVCRRAVNVDMPASSSAFCITSLAPSPSGWLAVM